MTVLEYRSTSPPEGDLARPQGHWLLWAIYLAMSWTWCIGMFLPVLLVRDYGIWGFVVFAAPNVIGAAAMGWIIRSASTSSEIATAHRIACRSFSVLTLVFHIVFVVWLPTILLLPISPWLALIALCFVVMLSVVTYHLGHRNPGRQGAAVVTLMLSASLFAVACFVRKLPHVEVSGIGSVIDMPALAAVSLFGFALCPYLDLTFHRARQNTSRVDARVSFAVGFGVFFLAMLLFTLTYSGWLTAYYLNDRIPRAVAVLVATHVLVQTGLTTGLHARELVPRIATPVFICIAVGLALVMLFVLFPLIFGGNRFGLNFRRGESIYRCFMGFYGLVFPSYVWLCMIPSPRTPPSRKSLIVLAAAVVLAGPFFWLGFIEGPMVWLLPGLAIVLAARVVLPRRETLAKI